MWNLELLDVSGSKNLDDQFMTNMQKCEVTLEDNKHVAPGMQKL